MTISITFEILVSILLAITIGYCIVLDRRLKALRTGQDGVRQSITELIQATGHAEQSVRTLRETGNQIVVELEERILEAKMLSGNLKNISSATTRKSGRISALPKRKKPEQGQGTSTSLMDRLKRAG